MSGSEGQRIRWHEDRELFRAAVSFTAAQTAFAARLIEKDYFCTLVIEHLAGSSSLVFKGGTCLAKVHAGFYRLSEDLDYAIHIRAEATRTLRSAKAAGLKEALADLPARVAAFHIVEPFVGANESTQYVATVGYTSLLTGQDEAIRIEVGLREPLMEPPLVTSASAILLDPITNSPMVTPVRVRCISLREAYAEKLRAALSRRDVAIRDFFDIDYAVREVGLDLDDHDFVSMVKAKLAVPGNPPVDVSEQRLAALQRQLEPQLRPVLRPGDFEAFDLDRATRIVLQMAARVGGGR